MAKSLKYYLENPDEMPTDPKEIEALANEHMAIALEGGTEEVSVERFSKAEKEEEAPAAPQEAVKEEVSEAKPEAVTEEPVETKPEGVLTKDGKHIIPYSQLESARQRASAAEQLAADQAAELERLRTQVATGVQQKTPEVEVLTDDELNALAEDSPTLAKILRSQQSVIKHLNQTVGELAERDAQLNAERTSAIQEEVQSAIDANSKLSAWQTAEDKTMWDRAAFFDKTLRESPEYWNVPFEERFKKVVALTEADFGTEVTEKPEQPTQQQIREVAKAKLDAKAKTAIPRSLSDIPGGAPPAVDEHDKVDQMSTVALGQMFQGMTKDQLEAYLSSNF